jgi:AcrR family transcriptional regulator
MAFSATEGRLLDAAKTCCERWGFEKVTIDDIAAASGVSRATLYRLFPGGKDVLFDALRVRELEEFFALLAAQVEATDSLEDLLVAAVVTATCELRADQHLALMMASEPGETLSQLTVAGLPRIIRMASVTLTPLVASYVPPQTANRLIDVLARLTISYFLAPSADVDLGDETSARAFLRPVIAVLAPSPAVTSSTLGPHTQPEYTP